VVAFLTLSETCFANMGDLGSHITAAEMDLEKIHCILLIRGD